MDYDTIADAGSKVTYAGGGSAFLFGMTANELAAIGGLIIAVIGLIINGVFKWLAHRAMLEHHKQIQKGRYIDE
jgi:hypothetical protein